MPRSLMLWLLWCVGGAWCLPSVVWWTEMLFPHPGEGEEVACPGGGRCLARRRGSPPGEEGETAYLFYGTDFKGDDLPLPRREGDLWSLLHEESPMNNFVLHLLSTYSLLNPLPHPRDTPLPLPTLHRLSLPYLTRRPPLPTHHKNRLRKQGLAPVLYLQSHCGVSSDRDRYVRRLMRLLPVDSYGGCLRNAPLPLPLRTTDTHHSPLLMDFIARYKFHLAFENAICEDYVTEKLFRALHVGSVPIYRGSPSMLDWAPSPTSVVVADHFRGPEELARFILRLDADDTLYDAYLAWKGDGVSNAFLKKTLEDRTWTVDDPTDTGQVHDPASMDFIRGFECYVCDQLCGKIPRPPPPDQRHMNCPPPHPSLPHLEDFDEEPEKVDSCRLDKGSCPLLAEGPLTDGHEMSLMRWSVDEWLRDYQFAAQQAEAIARMLHTGEGDSARFLHHLDTFSPSTSV
ncbi:hypothetical protein JTE90_005203 [Oedothorax gibbosus]|uniref:Fucosyltransferase n=1 Tax=Oedothorax gibbosus TaxID=931172 RepID=A0AAV6UK97_9ARAC|nr:hypothetical protein JTE90_005203 [Oedothorax gibbosus]